MSRIGCMVACIGIALLCGTSEPALTEARTVSTGPKGEWERQHPERALQLVEELSIGVLEGDEAYVIGKPADVAVDSRGQILVLDRGYCHVQKYDKEGRYVQSIGRKGEGPGEFYLPTAMTTDDFDNVYIAGDNKVSVFDESGRHIDTFGMSYPEGVVRSIRVDANADLFVSCLDIYDQKVIHKFNQAHEPAGSFCDSYAAGSEIDVRIEAVYGGGSLDLDAQGHVFYTQMTPYEIREFRPDGAHLMTVIRQNDFIEPPKVEMKNGQISYMGGFSGSSAIVVLPGGRFMNVVQLWEPDPSGVTTIIDLFKENGILLASLREIRDIDLKCSDVLGRVYGIDRSDFPRVVRYKLAGD